MYLICQDLKADSYFQPYQIYDFPGNYLSIRISAASHQTAQIAQQYPYLTFRNMQILDLAVPGLTSIHLLENISFFLIRVQGRSFEIEEIKNVMAIYVHYDFITEEEASTECRLESSSLDQYISHFVKFNLQIFVRKQSVGTNEDIEFIFKRLKQLAANMVPF